MKPPVEAPTSRQRSSDGIDREGGERRRQLLAAARDERRPEIDVEPGVGTHVRAGLGHDLVVDAHPAREHQGLCAAAALDEAAFGEQDVEADHARSVAAFPEQRRSGLVTYLSHR